MQEKPVLDKKIFNQDDFDILGWHDASIYSISFNENNNSLIFNIDYIIQWVHPEEHKRDNTFDFWISPAILIFKDVYEWNMNLKVDSFAMQVDIIHIAREEAKGKSINNLTLYNYIFECSPGNSEIKILNNLNFEMHLLAEPVYCESQKLEANYRNNIIKENFYFLSNIGLF